MLAAAFHCVSAADPEQRSAAVLFPGDGQPWVLVDTDVLSEASIVDHLLEGLCHTDFPHLSSLCGAPEAPGTVLTCADVEPDFDPDDLEYSLKFQPSAKVYHLAASG